MRILLTLAILSFLNDCLLSQNIGIGTNTPDSSAILDLASVSQGLLVPRMTTAERQAITNPADGLFVFDTDTGSFHFFQNNEWFNMAQPLLLSDQDGDTSIEVERTADEDKIHFKVGGHTLHSIIRTANGRGRLEVSDGLSNTFMGEFAGQSNTGFGNTFIGAGAGKDNTSGGANTFIGGSGGDNTTGSLNTFLGNSAGARTTTGSQNNFFGQEAGFFNNFGHSNNYMGYRAGKNSNGSNNVMIGDSAGVRVNGNGNVFIGKQAGSHGGDVNETRNNRLYIQNSLSTSPLIYGEFDNQLLVTYGQLSVGTSVPGTQDFTIFDQDGTGGAFIRMFTNSADQNDVLLGFNDSNNGFLIRTVSNHDIKFQTNGASTRMVVKNDGDVGIGTQNPSHKLHVNGVARSTQSTWETSSDKRVKKNIQDIGSAGAIISKIRPVTFEWKDEYKDSQEGLDSFNYGFIAQEIEKVIPEAVSIQTEQVGDETIEDFRTLNVGPVLPILVKAVKEQQEEIEILKKQNKLLMEKMDALLKREGFETQKTLLGQGSSIK